MSVWDAVVVGAGPAGSLAAREMARAGVSVLLLDRASFPRWKVCGACLSPGALSVLDDSGLGGLPASLGGLPVGTLVLATAGRSARLRLAGTVAVSRTALDDALVAAAVDAGVTFLPRARASLAPIEGGRRRVGIVRNGIATEVAARVVIDATGLGGSLGPASDRTTSVSPGSRIGLGVILDASDSEVPAGELHMVVGRAGYVGLVRVEDGRLNVAAAVDAEALRALGPQELVDGILAGAGRPPLRVHGGWHGTPALTRAPAGVGEARVLRVGDAAGYVEPFTGEGICWALAAGRSAARLALRGIEGWCDELVRSWSDHHRRDVRRSRALCRTAAAALRRPRLVALAVAALKLSPGLADPFIRRAARAPSPLDPALT